jgi:hypothetical protein
MRSLAVAHPEAAASARTMAHVSKIFSLQINELLLKVQVDVEEKVWVRVLPRLGIAETPNVASTVSILSS